MVKVWEHYLEMVVLCDGKEGVSRARHIPHGYNFACPHANKVLAHYIDSMTLRLLVLVGHYLEVEGASSYGEAFFTY